MKLNSCHRDPPSFFQNPFLTKVIHAVPIFYHQSEYQTK